MLSCSGKYPPCQQCIARPSKLEQLKSVFSFPFNKSSYILLGISCMCCAAYTPQCAAAFHMCQVREADRCIDNHHQSKRSHNCAFAHASPRKEKEYSTAGSSGLILHVLTCRPEFTTVEQLICLQFRCKQTSLLI